MTEKKKNEIENEKHLIVEIKNCVYRQKKKKKAVNKHSSFKSARKKKK